jgi:hypothetical protein
MHLESLQLRVARLPPWIREVSIFGIFLLLTAIMTWPWVTSLRDAVSDTGDPYMIAWTLWWDYHQTFHDPLNLFHANIFYPYKYTLAFSEHDFGIALLFFPLFAAGFRPLTVHSIATFSGFAFCGYAAFRLTRTLTNSNGAAWIAGVVFGFIPFRFQLLSHLHYLFAGWIPLLIEAAVLFVRERSWKRAIWLGVAFLMNALTCITWFILTAIPLAITAGLLVIRYWPNGENRRLLRAVPVLLFAVVLLAPFMWPYYKVTQLYDFRWPTSEAFKFSAGWSDWFAVYPHIKLWGTFGSSSPNVMDYLFPGLSPLLLSAVALFWVDRSNLEVSIDNSRTPHRTWLLILDALSMMAAVIAVLGFGYKHVQFFAGPTSDRALSVLLLLLIVRWNISYPLVLRRSQNRNLIDSIRSPKRSEAFWVGTIWAVTGFLGSIGLSFFLNRFLYDLLLPFRSLRVPARAAMLCYVGLAVLAGMGGVQLARVVGQWRPGIKEWVVYSVVVVAVLFELNAAPLSFVHGAVDTDAVSQRLKETNFRGGVVELPGATGAGFQIHLAMLRAADHERPLVNAASTFGSAMSGRIDASVVGPGVKQELMDLLEQIPASYVVMRHEFIAPERKADFADFLNSNVASGRLRLVGVYDKNVELYVVTKTEEQK